MSTDRATRHAIRRPAAAFPPLDLGQTLDATRALQQLDKSSLGGRTLHVVFAKISNGGGGGRPPMGGGGGGGQQGGSYGGQQGGQQGGSSYGGGQQGGGSYGGGQQGGSYGAPQQQQQGGYTQQSYGAPQQNYQQQPQQGFQQGGYQQQPQQAYGSAPGASRLCARRPSTFHPRRRSPGRRPGRRRAMLRLPKGPVHARRRLQVLAQLDSHAQWHLRQRRHAQPRQQSTPKSRRAQRGAAAALHGAHRIRRALTPAAKPQATAEVRVAEPRRVYAAVYKQASFPAADSRGPSGADHRPSKPADHGPSRGLAGLVKEAPQRPLRPRRTTRARLCAASITLQEHPTLSR
ncbi:hypothetical protein M885DRAFT_145919 [Pelagophyceae sp. CCMP2097]|nr:hypothetical protein M885DRAFT_145919 [Pelagophyceae sp. CCMP2097]